MCNCSGAEIDPIISAMIGPKREKIILPLSTEMTAQE